MKFSLENMRVNFRIIFVFGVCICIEHLVQAQDQIASVVVDKSGLEPIPYAQIRIGSKSYFSDLSGSFKIPLNGEDSIQIRRLGFNSLNLATISISDTVYLDAAAYTLPEIEIRDFDQKAVSIGYHTSKTLGHADGMKNSMGVIIEHPHAEASVSMAIISLSDNRKSYIYEVQVYRVDELERPTECIHLQQFVSSSSTKKLKIPFSPYHLKLTDNKVFVVIRWLPGSEAELLQPPKLKTTGEISEPVSFLFFDNLWHSMDYQIESGEFFNYKIGLELLIPSK